MVSVVARLQPSGNYPKASGLHKPDGQRPLNSYHSAGAERRRLFFRLALVFNECLMWFGVCNAIYAALTLQT